MTDRLNVSIVGGSGYVGGELLRLLLFHPQVRIKQITSASQMGKFVHSAHPNLRSVTDLQFSHPDSLEKTDLLFVAQPHGFTAERIDHFSEIAPYIVDTSADFRLQAAGEYQHWYGGEHPNPEWLSKYFATFGLFEKGKFIIVNNNKNNA